MVTYITWTFVSNFWVGVSKITKKSRGDAETEVMAAIEMILLIAFSKYSKLQPLMKLLQVLEVQSSGTPFLEQMEAKLNYIGKFPNSLYWELKLDSQSKSALVNIKTVTSL